MNWNSLIVNFGPAIFFLMVWLFFIRKYRQRYSDATSRSIELAEENLKILREILEILKSSTLKK
jgi:hypothetical protein